MTYNHHGSDILNGKKISHYKTINSTAVPSTFRTTYDTQLIYKNPYESNHNSVGKFENNNTGYRSNISTIYRSTVSKTVDSKEQDISERSKAYGFRKPLNTYSTNNIVVNAPRVQPNYLSTTRLSYQHLLNQIAQITESVYLSSISAITLDRIRELGVTMLVSMITDPVPIRASNLENVLVPIEDTEYANLRSYLDRVVDKIHREEIKGGKILVHCIAGVSRSSSLVIAYLMKYHAMRLRQAYNHVRARRPYIQPNIGFWKQLIEFEKRLFGSPSVRLLPNNDNTVAPDVPPSALGSVLFNTSTRYNKNRYGYSQF